MKCDCRHATASLRCMAGQAAACHIVTRSKVHCQRTRQGRNDTPASSMRAWTLHCGTSRFFRGSCLHTHNLTIEGGKLNLGSTVDIQILVFSTKKQ